MQNTEDCIGVKTLGVEAVAKTSRSTVQHLTTRTHRFMNIGEG